MDTFRHRTLTTATAALPLVIAVSLDWNVVLCVVMVIATLWAGLPLLGLNNRIGPRDLI
ncbi:hypothetical protein [Antrihabitans cavernicola]|uniref:hypothetical protein n=1 Tax=Antrihabitans cavernicola TaxID=2495913 RepID=UPI001659BC72|nr:hypothetical protein [Spelaeibacter cavernicola]